MTLRIGVIGTGMIGTYHVERLATRTSRAEIAAVFDVDTDRAGALASRIGAKTHGAATDVIEDPGVEAVLVASPGDLHAQQVTACIEAGKPVFCEKPLATSAADALEVVRAEVAGGRQLVQLGFMRRYDPGYLGIKAALDEGRIGEALLLHSVHRNPTVPDFFREFMAITDSVVHEMDTTRWLLGEEIVAVSVRTGKKSPHAPAQDPQMVHFETESGVLVDVESFVNCQYGYDVRCELVGTEGYATLDTPTSFSVASSQTRSVPVPPDWRVRFDAAFEAELQAWVNGVLAQEPSGASAWDGYAATAVAEAAVRAQRERVRVDVDLAERPSFYGKG